MSKISDGKIMAVAKDGDVQTVVEASLPAAMDLCAILIHDIAGHGLYLVKRSC